MGPTLPDPGPVAICPACGGSLDPGTALCSACQDRGRARGTRHPAAKAIIGVAWFCTAVVILWFFGSLAKAPWEQAARDGPMLLPGGGHLDLTLGRGATPRCAVSVRRDGATREVVIMQRACSRIVAHRWLRANRELPQFQGAMIGTPYTVPAPPGAEAIATRTRVVVSCLFTLVTGLVGGLLIYASVGLASRLMTPPKAGAGNASLGGVARQTTP